MRAKLPRLLLVLEVSAKNLGPVIEKLFEADANTADLASLVEGMANNEATSADRVFDPGNKEIKLDLRVLGKRSCNLDQHSTSRYVFGLTENHRFLRAEMNFETNWNANR